MYAWPADRHNVAERVEIDFHARLHDLAELTDPGQLPVRIRANYYSDLGHRYQKLYDAIRKNSVRGHVEK